MIPETETTNAVSFSGPPGLSENVSEGVSRMIRSLSDLPRLPERKTAARHEHLDADPDIDEIEEW